MARPMMCGWRCGCASFLVSLLCISPLQAQTALEEEKLKTQLAEEKRKQAEAAAAIAKAEVDVAQASAAAKADLAKAQAEAAKAKSDLYQSIVPDPDKYKIAEPKAPKVNASAGELTFRDAQGLAAQVAGEVGKASLVGLSAPSAASKCDAPLASVIVSDPKVRALIALAVATRKSLELATAQLQTRIRDVQDLIDEPPLKQPDTKFLITSTGGIMALSSIGELAASFAKIAKSQYAFETIQTTTATESAFKSMVIGALAANPCLQVIDPESVLSLVSDGTNLPPEATAAIALTDAVREARDVAKAAASAAKPLREKAATLKGANDKATEKLREPFLTRAAALDAAAKALREVADEKEKALAALYVVDAQGATAFDAAIRGGMLNDEFVKKKPRVLAIKAVSADVDVYAKDGLFRSLSVGVSSHTIVTWQLTDAAGKILTAGSVNRRTPLKEVELPK